MSDLKCCVLVFILDDDIVKEEEELHKVTLAKEEETKHLVRLLNILLFSPWHSLFQTRNSRKLSH